LNLHITQMQLSFNCKTNLEVLHLKRFVFIGVLLALFIFLLSSEGTNAQFYKIINKASSKAIDVKGSKPDNGTEIIQWEFNKGNNQLWEFEEVGNFVRIINKATGKCLDVEGGKSDNGVRIIQWEAGKGNNQLWELERDEKGFFKIISKATSKALTVEGASNENGARIIQWEVNNGNNQLWEIEPVN